MLAGSNSAWFYSNFLFKSTHGEAFAFPNSFLVLLLHQCPPVACPGRSEVFPYKILSSCKLEHVTHSFWHVLFYKKQWQCQPQPRGGVRGWAHGLSPDGRCHLLLHSSVTLVLAQEQPALLCSPKFLAFLALQHLCLILTTEHPQSRH